MKLRNWPIEKLPGLSDRHQAQLKQWGITSTKKLLKNASTPEAKLALAHQLGIHIQYVNKWAALAELASIPTVGCQYCGLLLHAGVASVARLAQMPVHKIHHQILRVQVGKYLTKINDIFILKLFSDIFQSIYKGFPIFINTNL